MRPWRPLGAEAPNHFRKGRASRLEPRATTFRTSPLCWASSLRSSPGDSLTWDSRRRRKPAVLVEVGRAPQRGSASRRKRYCRARHRCRGSERVNDALAGRPKGLLNPGTTSSIGGLGEIEFDRSLGLVARRQRGGDLCGHAALEAGTRADPSPRPAQTSSSTMAMAASLPPVGGFLKSNVAGAP